MGIEVNSYVSWAIVGGQAFGQVLSLNDKLVKVQTPSKQVVEANLDELVSIKQDEYDSLVQDLVTDIIGEDLMAENANLETEVTKLKNEITDKDGVIAKLTDELTKRNTELTEANTKINTLNDQIQAIELQRKGDARFNELNGISEVAIQTINSDAAKAKDILAQMSDDTYNLTLNLAQSFVKLTQVTQTNLPATTEQSQTSEPQLTEQVITATVDVNDSGLESNVVNVEDESDKNVQLVKAVEKFMKRTK